MEAEGGKVSYAASSLWAWELGGVREDGALHTPLNITWVCWHLLPFCICLFMNANIGNFLCSESWLYPRYSHTHLPFLIPNSYQTNQEDKLVRWFLNGTRHSICKCSNSPQFWLPKYLSTQCIIHTAVTLLMKLSLCCSTFPSTWVLLYILEETRSSSPLNPVFIRSRQLTPI